MGGEGGYTVRVTCECRIMVRVGVGGVRGGYTVRMSLVSVG